MNPTLSTGGNLRKTASEERGLEEIGELSWLGEKLLEFHVLVIQEEGKSVR